MTLSKLLLASKMLALLLLLALGPEPQPVTVLQLRSYAEPYLGKRIRVCGYMELTEGMPYLWELAFRNIRAGVYVRGKWRKMERGKACIVGQVYRVDAKRSGDPQYYANAMPDTPVHPGYYLKGE